MALDPATLGAVFVLLSIVLGGLLIFSWALNRAVQALAWWGGAFCLVAIGIAVANLLPGPAGYPTLFVANALVMVGYGSMYAGCRSFNGRGGWVAAVLTGACIWMLAFWPIHDNAPARLMALSCLAAAYAGLAAWELWRHEARPLASQRVAVVLLAALAFFNVCRGLLGLTLSSIFWIDVFAKRWSAEMALFLVVYGPTLAFMFLSMAKERTEFDYKLAALVDPLTGVPNRRAFLKNARELLSRHVGRPASCLLFDLDNFKRVNDNYGHEAGDRILSVFGETLARHLPRRSFGRLGGEEFGAILPLPERDAVKLAETVRHAFASSGQDALGFRAEVTVSVGCATAVDAEAEEMLRQADIALYRAKDGGRNAVVALARRA
ncbi:GGDEF domain-containing protein [Microvirga subterranea]|nr:GGDEF domain-containing protein [Microvirga subterranea]